MPMLGTPIPQRYRPIGLVLFDGGAIRWAHIFNIRPTAIAYSHPTRSSVQQTFEGAWVDDWGEGVAEVTIEVHHGWRGTMGVPGELMSLNLRRLVLDRFHALRSAKAEAGEDPDEIELFLVDTLNTRAYSVYPKDRKVSRDRSKPLLDPHRLHLIVLGPFSLGGIGDAIFGN